MAIKNAHLKLPHLLFLYCWILVIKSHVIFQIQQIADGPYGVSAEEVLKEEVSRGKNNVMNQIVERNV